MCLPLQVSAHRAVLGSKVTSPPLAHKSLVFLAWQSWQGSLWSGGCGWDQGGQENRGGSVPAVPAPSPAASSSPCSGDCVVCRLRATEESSLHNEYSERRDNLG